MKRALNFNAGPASLPEAVLEKAQKEWLNFNDTGMAVLEMSHRSKEYDTIHETAKQLLRKLLDIPVEYEVLFLQGGASLQFTMVPMNLLAGKQGCYVLTGSWSEKALQEAQKIGQTFVVASGKENQYRSIPDAKEIKAEKGAAYLHITSNNTIYGTQWHEFPKTNGIPLIADMSSDILSRPLPIQDFGLIYAGAQKNLGPSGVTVVIIKKELLARSSDSLPTMLNYQIHAKNRSLYNTPPTLAIFLLKLVLEWADGLGGLEKIEKANREKADLLYQAIDESDGFYIGHADPNSRSLMNATFTLHQEKASEAFLSRAKEYGFKGLNGHRSIGGCRASIYNAVPTEHVCKLVEFMHDFKKKH